MLRRKLPVGIEDFEEIRKEEFYYIDKTGLIRELLNNWGKVNLFTRPRRFGKTLNMSMLKCFFETGADETLFEGLSISREKALCEKYMGKFPVIFLSLKGVDGLDFENARDMLWEVIQKEFRRLQYLLQDERLSKPDRENFSSLMTARVSDSVIQKSLSLLTEILYRYHGQKVILLIDEYDVPLDKAFQHGYYEEMAALIRGLFGQALKTNEFLQFAVLTGCLRVSKESIFTGLNNFDVNSIVDVEHDEQFGFTDSEVQKLLADYGLEEKADVIKDWYDGYRFGDASIYCPWDVIKYAKKLLADPCAEPEAFWINTSGNELVKRFIDKADKTTQDEIECLIAGEVIEKAVRLDLTYNELDTSIENLWSVLFTTGYLTQTDRAAGGIYKLVIPNREVREVFVLQIKEWFRKITLADTARIQRFCAAFPAGDAATIQDMLHDYLWDSISVRDTAVRSDRKENFYHGMLVGLLQSRENWLIQSNTENGEGYSDITVCTPERTGIVIELKYADDGNLEKECLQALEQIEKKKYAAGLQHRGMKKVIRYGMAFWKKECMVVMAQAPDQP
ncbi:AAA family ATPase [Marvinbryantia formatexigens]|nr:AAA family ATPase [Marvinbryantia formatexigens]UWO25610.1 ATP-binding protein [Marvinbryantia formatexigens DSM 14469]SDG17663.1 PD-(D/E)XK nuclease superfamily protein [Marvinbryantia formatexigens]